MSLPKIVYNPGTGAVTLQFKRGPLNFLPTEVPRVHDNIATSGVKERVLEAIDLLLPFDMPGMLITDDLPAWAAFMKWAFGGSSFQFYPNAALTDYYNCVDETTTSSVGSSSSSGAWAPARVAPGVYSGSFVFRVLPDSQAPADAGVVLKRFYGITG